MIIATVDVGMTTAVAVWSGKVRQTAELRQISSWRVVEGRSLGVWLWYAVDQFMSYLSNLEFFVPQDSREVYLEGVTVFPSLKSLTSALRQDLTKLTLLVGAYAAALSRERVHVHIVRPESYRGHMPKKVINKRLERILISCCCSPRNQHERDAVYFGEAVCRPKALGLKEDWLDGY